MKECPILFSGPMVRAILDDKKTQTRRVMKPQPAYVWGWGVTRSDPEHFSAHVRYPGGHQPDPWVHCPYGKAGDRLWVREMMREDAEGVWRYAADNEEVGCDRANETAMMVWMYHYERAYCPSIFMPRWASRLAFENKGVRVERLQDISEEDAKAEGVEKPAWDNASYRCEFMRLWDEINPKYPWESNPWVWVIEFKRVQL